MSVTSLAAENFDEVIHHQALVIIDFWAPWCKPCLAFAPIFAQVSQKFPEIYFGSINIEDEPSLAKDFNIRSVPTLMIFKQNIAVYMGAGVQTQDALSALIQSAIDLDVSEVLSQIKKIEDK